MLHYPAEASAGVDAVWLKGTDNHPREAREVCTTAPPCSWLGRHRTENTKGTLAVVGLVDAGNFQARACSSMHVASGA